MCGRPSLAHRQARELRTERAEDAAVEHLVWRVQSWLPRRRFLALRRAALTLQQGVRATLLRWEVQGVRELRRDVHRRFVAHRQR